MIILASTSLTRQAILANAGLVFTPQAPNVDEHLLVSQNPHWTSDGISLQLARAKAEEVSSRHPEACVIGADQVLVLGKASFSKPKDTEDCRRQLLQLRGRTHQLISSVVCAKAGREVWSVTDHADLTMRDFSDTFLDSYLTAMGSDCTSSVGGYKIEGRGLQLFEKIRGDYFTILGLPLLPLLQNLRTSGEIGS